MAEDVQPIELVLEFDRKVRLKRRHIRVDGGTLMKVHAITSIDAPDAKFTLEWKLRVKPTTDGDMTISIPARRRIEFQRDGKDETKTKRLAGFEQVVEGPAPKIQAMDARRKRRGRGSTSQSLNKAAKRPDLGEVATADGSPRPARIHTQLRQSHSPPARTRRVEVALLDDAKDEGREFFYLNLSNPNGASITRRQAKGTIINSDPLPKASMARFGRSVASQILDTVTARFDGTGAQHVTLGGHRIGVARMGYAREQVSESRGMSAHELLTGSSFHFTTGEMDSGLALSAWGRAATGSYRAAGIEDMAMEGSVTTGLIGTDLSSGRLLTGVALSHSRGEDAFDLWSGLTSNRVGGTGESILTSFHPYAHLRFGPHASVWALAGHGTGTFTLFEQGGLPVGTPSPDWAVGTRAALLAPEETGGLALSLKADAFWMQMTSAAVRSERAGNLASGAAESHRVRMTLEGRRTFEMGSGLLTPTLAASLRQDRGDAETGSGVEIGAGLLYAAPGVTVEGSVHGIVAHNRADYDGGPPAARCMSTPAPVRRLGRGAASNQYAGLRLSSERQRMHTAAALADRPGLSLSMEGHPDGTDRPAWLMAHTALR